jgi:manganese/iron transport system permease protein
MDESLVHSLITVVALATACAFLSVPVVLRRWAFIGEGISHAGFGGAGTVWLLAVIWPEFDQPHAVYIGVVMCCLLTAVGIALLSNRERINADAAIGIFLVATLAWGFVARQIYVAQTHHEPAWFESLLFGQMNNLSRQYAVASAMISAAVVFTLVMLMKEIIAYCFDPVTAQASGARSGLIHYVLMILLALTIVVGVRVAGSVLMTALLVLPGVIGTLLSRRWSVVTAVAAVSSILGAIGGVAINAGYRVVPVGPAIVLVLVIEFLFAYIIARAITRRIPAALAS